jgi:hypothetical protein
MGQFKEFMESNESDARETIRKLPKSHRQLVRGFSLSFHPNGTLKGDNEHIGKVENMPGKKKITLAAPYYYPREFALLHEIGHLVYARYVKGTKLEKQWMSMCGSTENKVRQSCEEIFCHSYANVYGHNKISKHDHSNLESFIKRLPKQ